MTVVMATEKSETNKRRGESEESHIQLEVRSYKEEEQKNSTSKRNGDASNCKMWNESLQRECDGEGEKAGETNAVSVVMYLNW